MALNAASVWRRYVTDGVPLSGAHEPDKDEIIALLTAYENALGTGFKQVFFSTLAAATAANINAAADYVVTIGRNAAGDNGGATYIRIPASSAAAWRFQSADGQMWAINNKTVTPEMFGAFGGADCTAAFQSIASWLVTASQGVEAINFNPGQDYKIWPAGGATPGVIFTLTGIKGVTWNFNGARIVTDNLFSPQGLPFVFLMDNCNRLTFNNPCYVQTAYTTLDDTKGGTLFMTVDSSSAALSRGIVVNNLQQTGGRMGFGVVPNGRWAKTTENIRLNNSHFDSVYYPLSFQNGGDDVEADYTTTNCGRAYFPYGVSNHDISVISDGGGLFNDCLLKVYAAPSAIVERNTLSNIKLKYRNSGRSNSSTSQSLVALDLQQTVAKPTVSAVANNGSGKVRLTVSSTANMATGQIWFVAALGGFTAANLTRQVVTVINGTTVDLPNVNFAAGYTSGGYLAVPATMKNIEVLFDVNGDSNQQPPAILTYKHLSDGSYDTAASGHTIENVEFSGTLKGYDYSIPAIDMFNNNVGYAQSGGTWTSETLRNIAFRDFSLDGVSSSVLLDLTNVSGFLLENVTCAAAASIPWTVVKGERLVRSGKVDVPAIPSTGVALTANSITVPGYVDDQDFAGSATQTATLPDPTLCKDKVLNVRNTAAQTVNSASSNVVPLAGGAAGTALLAATAGKWARLKSNGTAWVITAAA